MVRVGYLRYGTRTRNNQAFSGKRTIVSKDKHQFGQSLVWTIVSVDNCQLGQLSVKTSASVGTSTIVDDFECGILSFWTIISVEAMHRFASTFTCARLGALLLCRGHRYCNASACY